MNPEKSMARNILKNPNTKSQFCQQVNIQISHAKQYLNDEVPMSSAFKRKFSSSKKHLYDQYVAFQKKRLPLARPLNETYFYQLMHEMKLIKVDTIQQCSYCFDLKKNMNDITLDRLATCFLHEHIRRQQSTAYLLDKQQLNEGIIIFVVKKKIIFYYYYQHRRHYFHYYIFIFLINT